MPERSPHSPHLARRSSILGARGGSSRAAGRAASLPPVRPLARTDAPLAIGARLRHERELRGFSVEEVARATRIPLHSIERIESDRFDDLPGEVFVRGFLRSYAGAIGVDADEILALYGSARRVQPITPVPVSTAAAPREGRRVGVAIAFVLLLVLCTMALSFVLRPRGRDLPTEVSSTSTTVASHTA